MAIKSSNAMFTAALAAKQNRVVVKERPLILLARQNTVEGFIAFRKAVCYPQQVVTEAGIIAEDDEGAIRYATPVHHLSWTNLLMTGKDSSCLYGISGQPILILSPRGSAKSRYFTEWISWQIGIQTNFGIPLKIVGLSYNVSISEQKSIEIKRIIESDLYRQVFPTVRPGRKWADSLWEIDKKAAGLPTLGEPYTMSCAGLTGSVTSKRAHIIFGDDLIKSPADIANPTIREQMSHNWDAVVKPTLYPGGQIIVLGTRMSPDDLYATTYCEDKGWRVVEQPAILQDNNGKEYSYWQDYMPLEHLLKLRDPPEGNPITFSFQYQNKIVPISTLSIPETWIHYTDPLDEEFYEKLIISSDLSTSIKESACFTVFLIIGRCEREYHVLDCWRARTAGNNEKCRGILAIASQWGLVEVDETQEPLPGETIRYKKGNRHTDLYIEDAGQQQSLKHDFIEFVYQKMGISNIKPVMVGVGNGKRIRGDKRERLSGITGLLENGSIKFNRYRFNKHSPLILELLNFGSTSYSDCVDALTLGIHSLGLRPQISTS